MPAELPLIELSAIAIDGGEPDEQGYDYGQANDTSFQGIIEVIHRHEEYEYPDGQEKNKPKEVQSNEAHIVSSCPAPIIVQVTDHYSQ